MAQRGEQVEVEIDGNGETTPRKTDGGDSFRRRSKDQLHNDALKSDGPEVLRCSSNSFSRNSWQSPVSKTRSRLIDPPEKSNRLPSSGRVLGKGGDEDDAFDSEDIPEEYKRIKFNAFTLIQWVSLVFVIVALVCNLWIPIIRRQTLWDLPVWKWELLVLALICGRLVSGWGIRVVVFFVERNFLLRKRVLYFVYGLRKSVQNCLWLGFVLVVWHFIFDKKVEEETKSRILPNVTRIWVCFLVGTVVWLLKTILVKVLALSFHVKAFFDRIQESLFNQYVFETLSGPPFERNLKQEEEEKAAAEMREFQKGGACIPRDLKATLLRNGRVNGSGVLQHSPTIGKSPRYSSRQTSFKSGKQDEEISVNHLQKLNQKNVSAWNMRRMMDIIRQGSLTTLDERLLKSDNEDDASLEIRTEFQAKEAAKKIFFKVAKPGNQCIFLEDVMCLMHKDEALKTFNLFGVAENEGISKTSLKDWVVKAFRERRALALSLNDTKTAVDKLHSLLNVVIGVIIVIISLVILGLPVRRYLILLSSQILVVVFIFGNTCKTVFEAIIFLFVMHPFDVGDRCEVDGVQMVVEEINLLTTVFLRFDNQKITYPNSILATKPIANYYRSPDMGDAVDFCVHIATPLDKLAIVKERIIEYIETRNDYWHPAPMLVMRDVEDLNKLKISVWVTHKMNHQDMAERWTRRALLVEAMVKVSKELDIQYRLLPIDVNVRNIPSSTSTMPPSNWTARAPLSQN